MFNFALRMLGDVPAAEDITQEAFLSAWQNVKRFKGSSFQSWLYRIVANACLDELRRRKRHPAVGLDSLAEEPAASPAASPEECSLQQELGHHVQECLQKLPADIRAAVVLRDMQGLSYEDIAQALGCPLGTVRSRIARGRLQLRDLLGPQL